MHSERLMPKRLLHRYLFGFRKSRFWVVFQFSVYLVVTEFVLHLKGSGKIPNLTDGYKIVEKCNFLNGRLCILSNSLKGKLSSF